MKLYEWVNIKDFEALVVEKYISVRPHPRFPELKIANYTPAAQGLSTLEWNDTLSKSRGLVYSSHDWEIQAIPFSKFWSWDDPRSGALPEGIPVIYDKLDGSYLQIFDYGGNWIVSTRGSFESDQAKWADKWIKEHLTIPTDLATRNYNFIFEVIIPEDRKVVEYDFSGLVFLGSTNKVTGREYPPEVNTYTFQFLKDVPRPVIFNYESLEKLATQNEDNREGYVATWFLPNGSVKRAKIKFERYKLLHRMYFQTTTTVIWELLRSAQYPEYVKNLPNNLYSWVLGVASGISAQYDTIESQSKEEFRLAMNYTNVMYDLEASEKDRRKAFAFKAVQSSTPHLLFALYDAKLDTYKELLWDLVRPKNARYREVEE